MYLRTTARSPRNVGSHPAPDPGSGPNSQFALAEALLSMCSCSNARQMIGVCLIAAGYRYLTDYWSNCLPCNRMIIVTKKTRVCETFLHNIKRRSQAVCCTSSRRCNWPVKMRQRAVVCQPVGQKKMSNTEQLTAEFNAFFPLVETA